MELGADGVLMNTAIAEAEDAGTDGGSQRDAIIGGRKAFLGRAHAKKTLRFRVGLRFTGVVR